MAMRFTAEKDPLIRPCLKWAGGKRQLLPEIRKHLPPNMEDHTYYEPFVGAGALFFSLQPRRAVINDFNTQLILTYRMIKENTEELIRLLKEHQERNTREYYYELRNLDRRGAEFANLRDVEKAARLIFLNKTCYNGLYRVNARGLFNVPYGKYKKPAICEEGLLRRMGAYFNTPGITILNVDFEEALGSAGQGSFVYFDPPYHSPSKTGFTGYQAGGFGRGEQERLRNLMLRLTGLGAKCLLSNADTEYIRDLYDRKDFITIPLRARRYINSNPAGRGDAGELLIKNWKD
jgi:DNA adenine methylase